MFCPNRGNEAKTSDSSEGFQILDSIGRIFIAYVEGIKQSVSPTQRGEKLRGILQDEKLSSNCLFLTVR